MMRQCVSYDVATRRMTGENIGGLTALVRERIELGWKPYLMTLMFAPIPRSPVPVVGVMGGTVERLYARFVTNVVRRPNSARSAGSLPILIAAPDLPVAKNDKANGRAIVLNDGLHMHAVLLVPPRSRLKTGVVEHFQLNQSLYARWPLSIVDVRAIDHTPECALDYVLKSISRRRFSFDDVLILPRTRSEVISEATTLDPQPTS